MLHTQPPTHKTYFIDLPLARLHVLETGQGAPLIMVPATISELENWLPPFLAALRHRTRARMCPVYVAGLISADRKSVQSMAATPEVVKRLADDIQWTTDLGNAFLAQRAGVEPHAAVAGAILNQALSLASGVILVGLVGPAALRQYGGAYVEATVILGVLALLAVLALTSTRALALLQRALPSSLPRLVPVPLGVMAGSLAVNAVAWAGYGVAFLALARGLTPDANLSWSQATAVFTISYLVGLVALFAPGGVGVRESAFTLLLAPPLGLKLAVALALASRVLLTITELGAAMPFLLVRKGPPR